MMKILLAVWVLVGCSLPALADRVVVRAGMVGGDHFGGMAGGVDYVREERGGRLVMVSLDQSVDLRGIFDWSGTQGGEVHVLTLLAFSRSVAGRSMLLGGGLASVGRLRLLGEESEVVQPLVRLCFTTSPRGLLVAQAQVTAVAGAGTYAGLFLGVGF